MKKFLLISIFIILGSLTSGCVKFVTTVNEDGTGIWAFAVLLSSDELATAAGDETYFMLLRGETVTDEQSGIVFTSDERLENGHYWTYFVGEVSDPEVWGSAGSAFDRVFPEVEAEWVPLSFFAPDVLTDEASGIIRVSVDIDDSEASEILNVNELGGLTQISVEFLLPGELTDHNGTIDSLTGNPVWVIRGDNSEDLHFFAESRIE
jgi:hypothetical protein